MDLMAQYGSDEEEEEQEVSPPSSPTSHIPTSFPVHVPVVKNHISSKGSTTVVPAVGGKKKKMLDISFLPSEIQDLLTRGDYDVDSDDDQIASKKPIANNLAKPIVTTTSKPTKETASIDPLLRSLPPPKNSNTSDNYTFNKPPEKKSINPFKRNYADIDESFQNEDPTEYDYDDDAYEQDEHTKSYGEEQDEEQDETHPTSSSSFSLPATSSEQQSDLATAGNSQTNKKRKERHIEQMLMAGDTSVLGANTQVRTVAAEQHTWDAMKYSDQQQKEQLIMKKYTNDGGTKAMVQPTKIQNRRHQLSSLALRAAESEIAMLDATASRMKTKSQTQSRYGW